ncbi:hypothetical protein [Luteitalea sp.]
MAVIQVTPIVRGTGTPLAASLVFPAPITAGSTVAALIHQSGITGRTFGVTEGGSPTGWSSIFQGAAASIGVPRFFGRPNHPGSNDTLLVGHGQNTVDFAACAIEFEAGTSLQLVLSDEFVDAAVTDFHRASNTGLTTGDAVLGLISAGAANTNFTNGVPKSGSGWTKIGGTDANYFFAYQEFPSGTTAQLGEWDSAGTDRVARSGMVLLGTAATVARVTGGWFGR